MYVIHYICIIRYNLDQPYLNSSSNDTLVWVLTLSEIKPWTNLSTAVYHPLIKPASVSSGSFQHSSYKADKWVLISSQHQPLSETKPSARQLTQATGIFVFAYKKTVFHLFSYSFYAVTLQLALIPSLSGLNAEEWRQSINNLFTPKRRHNGETGKSPKAEGSSPTQAQRAGMDPTSKKQSRRVKQAGTGSGGWQVRDNRIAEHWSRSQAQQNDQTANNKSQVELVMMADCRWGDGWVKLRWLKCWWDQVCGWVRKDWGHLVDSWRMAGLGLSPQTISGFIVAHFMWSHTNIFTVCTMWRYNNMCIS